MKVVIDDKIPYIKEAIEKIADEVVYAEGKSIDHNMVKDADALIVRTRTRCDKALLDHTNVQFIATATIGFDHIDTDYCRTAGIHWQNAPGCNAASVAQYIHSALILLEQKQRQSLEGKTLGIVGVGHVGSLVQKVGKELGMNCLLCDAPRQDTEHNTDFVSLEQISRESDIVTFHVPLIKEGKYKTRHMADKDFLLAMKRDAVLINTARGEVSDNNALLWALNNHIIGHAILDVWENEPDINLTLLYKTIIGTPHIAGYSADGKANATRMALDALCTHFGVNAHYTIEPPSPDNNIITAPTKKDALLKIYNPEADSNALKRNPDLFEFLRGNYPLRRESLAYIFTPETD